MVNEIDMSRAIQVAWGSVDKVKAWRVHCSRNLTLYIV